MGGRTIVRVRFMKSRLRSEMRRARPLLGTIVDIQARGPGKITQTALEAGFAAVTGIQRLMSFLVNESDVSRLTRGAWRGAVKVHPLTWRVLEAAQKFSGATGSAGVFDITIAPSLAEWNYLPALDVPADVEQRGVARHCAAQRWERPVFGASWRLTSAESRKVLRSIARSKPCAAPGPVRDWSTPVVMPALSAKVLRTLAIGATAADPLEFRRNNRFTPVRPGDIQRATLAVSTETAAGCASADRRTNAARDGGIVKRYRDGLSDLPGGGTR